MSFRHDIQNTQFIRGGGTDVTFDAVYYDSNKNYIGYAQLTISSTATLLSAATVAQGAHQNSAHYMFAHVGARNTADAFLSYTDASTTATASIGVVVENGSYLNWMPGEG